MWPRYTYSLNRYLALSLFLHIVAIGGVFQYLHRADGQSVHTRAPIRITITAPPLPAESALDMDRKTPPLPRAHPRVMVADHTPSAPAPLIAPVTTGSPAFISEAIPPLPTREMVLQRPLASVSVPVPVQALSPSATRQPKAISTPPIPLARLKHLPTSSPTLAHAPEPIVVPEATPLPPHAIPPLPTRDMVLQRPLASVSVPVPVQALSPSATRQPKAISTPTIPLPGLKHLPISSPTLIQAPEPTVVTQATPLPPNTPRMRPEPAEMSPAA
ncbi:MAG: hypothetical protein V3S24_06795, partial [Candidatus Tectomicrobia bacterium]